MGIVRAGDDSCNNADYWRGGTRGIHESLAGLYSSLDPGFPISLWYRTARIHEEGESLVPKTTHC